MLLLGPRDDDRDRRRSSDTGIASPSTGDLGRVKSITSASSSSPMSSVLVACWRSRSYAGSTRL